MSIDDVNEKISRRRFITESTYLNHVKDHGAVDTITAMMIRQGISDIALAHPDWDMDHDLRTRAQWRDSLDVI